MKYSLVLLFAGAAALRQSLRGIRKSVFYATSTRKRTQKTKAPPQVKDEIPIYSASPTTERVPPHLVIPDSLSWDTVTNALVLRLTVEALRQVRLTARPLELRVFISDFHHERFEENARWALGVAPAILGDYGSLTVRPVPSAAFADPSTLAGRMEHEERGVRMARKNARRVRTLGELYAYLLLGGHSGLWDYMHGEHAPAKGGGW